MLGLERLELRRLRFDLLMCYKITHNHVNINRDCFFTFATYPGTRGHSIKLLPDSHIALLSELYQYGTARPMMLSQLQIYTCLKTGHALRGK